MNVKEKMEMLKWYMQDNNVSTCQHLLHQLMLIYSDAKLKKVGIMYSILKTSLGLNDV